MEPALRELMNYSSMDVCGSDGSCTDEADGLWIVPMDVDGESQPPLTSPSLPPPPPPPPPSFSVGEFQIPDSASSAILWPISTGQANHYDQVLQDLHNRAEVPPSPAPLQVRDYPISPPATLQMLGDVHHFVTPPPEFQTFQRGGSHIIFPPRPLRPPPQPQALPVLQEYSECLAPPLPLPQAYPAAPGPLPPLPPGPPRPQRWRLPRRTVRRHQSCHPSASRAAKSLLEKKIKLLNATWAIRRGDLEAAAHLLAAVKKTIEPSADPVQLLVATMFHSLRFLMQPPPAAGLKFTDVCSRKQQVATQILHNKNPCFKLAVMAANMAILMESYHLPKIHILDFDVGYGGQLSSLIHAMAMWHLNVERSEPPPSIKITAVYDPAFPFNSSISDAGETMRHLHSVGQRLAERAEKLNILLRFSVFNCETHELNRGNLGCEPVEAIAVNMALFLSRLPDETVSPDNPRDRVLRQVKGLEPMVVAMVEQDLDVNGGSLTRRFMEAYQHYRPLLESLDFMAERGSSERSWLDGCLARKMANVVARSGPDRVERQELHAIWLDRMRRAGFEPIPIRSVVVRLVQLRLNAVRENPGYTVNHNARGGWVGCGWKGRTLVIASTWR